ncbi:MAG: ABC transporter permease [Alphaproteobacteria bacterium]|nr:glutathione ABC transporter permease GsiC [Rhodospirillaceae bacterium]MDP6021407.1 ABC transporter permease [Alphaproteobacteria bacterium]MDP6257101.1 ABC transporter permease [Alphaproteobacteria bacterium]MDP7056616.1 ABC transporter permease [Alphaproteobacteria bacterium]MDP7230333.1 ABC transporter permease [Alphaproteobacteria bacterium]
MYNYLIRRLLAMVPTLFFASIICFSVVRMVPGDILDLMLTENDFGSGDPKTRADLQVALGIDKPIYVQYGVWITGIVTRFDFGNSLWQNTPVIDDIVERLPTTFELGLLSLIIALIVAIPIGIYSAVRQETLWDYVGRTVSILGLAVPSFWLGTMVVLLPAIWWGWSPPVEMVPFFEDPVGNLQVFIIPSMILGFSLSAVTMRMTRTMMLEVLRQDYVRTAWAKGLKERVVVMRHALKNALIPVVTLIGLLVPILIGGTVIIEQIFILPGMGQLLLDAVSSRDYPIITGVFLIIGIAVVFINLAIDICYGFLDPKVRYDQ